MHRYTYKEKEKNMKDKIFGVLQRVGRSFMLPIAILPVAGLLLGLGSSFTNATTIATYGLQGILGEGTILHSLLIIMNKVGSAIFDNLPLIFAVGVAIGMAKKEKEVATVSTRLYCQMHYHSLAVQDSYRSFQQLLICSSESQCISYGRLCRTVSMHWAVW